MAKIGITQRGGTTTHPAAKMAKNSVFAHKDGHEGTCKSAACTSKRGEADDRYGEGVRSLWLRVCLRKLRFDAVSEPQFSRDASCKGSRVASVTVRCAKNRTTYQAERAQVYKSEAARWLAALASDEVRLEQISGAAWVTIDPASFLQGNSGQSILVQFGFTELEMDDAIEAWIKKQ
jgi:hypothetical protein